MTLAHISNLQQKTNTNMTTIVYKDGILAGDTQVNEGYTLAGYDRKIFENNKIAYGMAGSVSACEEFMKFIEGKEFDKNLFQKEQHSNFSAIVVDKSTKEFSYYDNELIADKSKYKFIAIGTGKDFAKGAVLMGADAVKAVECASVLDHLTGGEIQKIIV